MDLFKEKLTYLHQKKINSTVQIYTLGSFSVVCNDMVIRSQQWGREKTIQLFQYLVTARNRRAQHKEQIITRLWEDADDKGGDRDFKVALHGIVKILEPDRKSRGVSRYILRQGLTYHLDTTDIWIDSEMMEHYIALGNELFQDKPDLAMESYQAAIGLYQGVYLPNRLYEDWTSEERERLQVLALGAYVALAELTIAVNPMESVRLSQKALQIDSAWEDAYDIQIRAYLAKGNRPLAIRTYRQCEKVLQEEFGIDPLPQTRSLIKNIT